MKTANKKVKCKNNISMSLYEINQNIMNSMPPVDNKKLLIIQNDINNFAKDRPGIYYYMLLNNDIHYYTVFRGMEAQNAEFTSFGAAVIDILIESNKEIIAGDAFEDRYELWLRDVGSKDTYVYLLFPYNEGVVTYGI